MEQADHDCDKDGTHNARLQTAQRLAETTTFPVETLLVVLEQLGDNEELALEVCRAAVLGGPVWDLPKEVTVKHRLAAAVRTLGSPQGASDG